MIETGSYWWPSLPLQRETQAGDKVVNMHEAKTGRSKSREDQLCHCLSPADQLCSWGPRPSTPAT